MPAAVRGQVAVEAKDWAGADRWFGEAVRLAPSPPFAYAEWAEVRLARGDRPCRTARSPCRNSQAAAKAPRFADPLET